MKCLLFIQRCQSILFGIMIERWVVFEDIYHFIELPANENSGPHYHWIFGLQVIRLYGFKWYFFLAY